MSETHEQFRERIGRIADETFHDEVNGAAGTIQEGGTLPAHFNFASHGFQRAAEAVYAQALRDVAEHFISQWGHTTLSGYVVALAIEHEIAAERGIDLDGGES